MHTMGKLYLQVRAGRDEPWKVLSSRDFYPRTSKRDDMLSKEDCIEWLENEWIGWHNKAPHVTSGKAHRVTMFPWKT